MPILLPPLHMFCKCNKVIKRRFPGSKLEVPWPHTAISLNIKTTCLNSGPLLAPKIPLSHWDMDSTRAAGVLWYETSNLASISFKSSQLWDGVAKAQLDLSASRRCSIRFSFGELGDQVNLNSLNPTHHSWKGFVLWSWWKRSLPSENTFALKGCT